MAHAAELDHWDRVIRVIVVSNDLEPNVEQWCSDTYGGYWKQTSYSGSFRKNFAGIGYTYNADLDAFVPPKPYPSWVLDDATCQWKAPVPMPQDGELYEWDEAAGEWVVVDAA
jgi:hypothetical protein